MYAKQTLDLLEEVRAKMSYRHSQDYLSATVESIRRSGGMEYPGRTEQDRGQAFVSTLETHLRNADAYFLTDEMLSVVLWAAKGLDETDTFDRELWPTDFGFLVIDKGLVSTEIRGRQIVTKAISWGPVQFGHESHDPERETHGGMQVVYWCDMDDARDEVNQDLIDMFSADVAGPFIREIRGMGRLQVNHVEVLRFGAHVGPITFNTSPAQDAETRRVEELSAKRLGLLSPSERAAHAYISDLPMIPQAENHARWVLAFLMMMNQTLTSVEPERVSPKAASRYAKKRIPSMVTVVQMRRYAGAHRDAGETRVEWHHRWIVRGFWRNQPYREDGQTVYRKIWIAPYVKGPEGLPFKQSTKIYALTR